MGNATGTDPVRGYAVGHFHDVQMGPEIVTYLERIDETLHPYRGRFIVHGGESSVLEGENAGSLVIVEFPDRAAATAWYHSDAYQEILPLRLRNAKGWVLLLDGVPDRHAATDVLAA